MRRWDVQLFGGLRIQSGDRVVTRFRTRSVDGIFAYLALHLGQDIRREKLIDLGWPGSEPLQGQQNLRTALTSIRSTLDPEVIEADRATVRLNPNLFEVDAVTFRRNRDVSIYAGRLLEGLDGPWVLPLALEFEELYVQLIIERLSNLEHGEAVKLGQEALKRHPGSVALRAKLRELDQGLPSSGVRAAPYQVSSFVGRESELGELARLIESNRLITLTGLGGSGKTRLAAELWNRNRPDAWFITLAELSDASFIGEAIRQGLRLPPSARLRGLEQVVDALERESGLLILDNYEHLLDGVSVVETLLASCPGLRIVTTSRVGLGLEGEIEFQVGPLELTPGQEGSLSESAQLFEARAQAVVPGFRVTEVNAKSVEELCARLDGFPLSLEFAAAKSRIFSPAEMLKQLNDRFEFLAHTGHGQGRRKTSLLDALDWSFDRLAEADQLLLCKLSIFEGGFTLDAAEKVCGSSPSGTQIETLSTAAWVERAPGSGTTRFRLLESVREYGSALLKPRDRTDIGKRHAEYYLGIARKCMEASFMPDEPIHHAYVREDIHNIDAAWLWLREHDPERALWIVCGLNWYWILSGLAHIGEARVKDAIQHVDPGPREIFAQAHHHCGNFIMFQGRFAEAEAWFRKAHGLFEAVGDKLFLGLAACQIGRVLTELGKFDEAATYVDLAIQRLLEVGDDNWICAGYTIRSLVANRVGDSQTAIEGGLQGEAYGRRGGYRWGLASCLNELAMAYHLAGDFRTSIAHQLESIAIKREQGALPSLALSLADLTSTYLSAGQVEEAKRAGRDCAAVLLGLNDHEHHARFFATVAELLWISGKRELAPMALAIMVDVTSTREVSASESEAFNRALSIIGRERLQYAAPTDTRTVLGAILSV